MPLPRSVQHRRPHQGRLLACTSIACVPPGSPMTTLHIYPVHEHSLEVIPGRFRRDWMEQTHERFAYRCLPMVIANTSGWELPSPGDFEASWDGGAGKEAISLRSLEDGLPVEAIASSHFGHGILTFHAGHIFVTDPGWGLNVRGAPNFVKDGIQALEGLVETDWLPFPFTMNWRFTRPGTVRFSKGDPLAFIVPIRHLLLDAIQPEIRDLHSNPELAWRYAEWRDRRAGFIHALSAGDPETVRQGWQRNYSRGTYPDGSPAPDKHVGRRSLKPPLRSG